MMGKGPKKHPVDIQPNPFNNDDTINDNLDNTIRILFVLQPT